MLNACNAAHDYDFFSFALLTGHTSNVSVCVYVTFPACLFIYVYQTVCVCVSVCIYSSWEIYSIYLKASVDQVTKHEHPAAVVQTLVWGYTSAQHQTWPSRIHKQNIRNIYFLLHKNDLDSTETAVQVKNMPKLPLNRRRLKEKKVLGTE